jgi:D-beta-D-heptose 7-phosphate kinase/D-beta-D-heptose 1-phosphate adenosyltransferase
LIHFEADTARSAWRLATGEALVNKLCEMFDGTQDVRVLVLGDVMLDRYTWGDAERVSPEAPVLVLRAEQEEVRLGGAASVAALLRHLNARVTLAGVIGDDAGGRTVRKLLDEAGIDDTPVLVDSDRCTTTKERFVGRVDGRNPHQMLRVDHEVSHPIEGPIQDRLRKGVGERLQGFQAILVSDYAKGACTPFLLRTVIREAHACGIPVLVDPARVADYGPYRGATLLTPNRSEAGVVLGRPIRGAADALAAGAELRRQLELSAVLVTLDSEGIAVAAEDHEIVGTRPRQVYDVTGAGDMVLAMAGLSAAIALPLREMAMLANAAAGLEVERFGVALVGRDEIRAELLGDNASSETQDAHNLFPVRSRHDDAPPSTKIVTLEEVIEVREDCRGRGQRIVLTNGCFDLLHLGHMAYLQQASQLGEVLVVAINSDASVRALKGPGRPVVKQSDRAAMLAALECVDYVLIFDNSTPVSLIQRIRPDVLVKGGDYGLDEVVGHDVVESYGGEVRVTAEIAGTSTTDVIARIRERPCK